MKSIGAKIKEQREINGLSQSEFASKTGLTVRTVSSYETNTSVPRTSNAKRICEVLGVSMAYLLNSEIEDPKYGLDEAPYVDKVRDRYGKVGAKDMEGLLNENAAFLAGGDIPQEDKDKFFQAIMAAYLATKEDASNRFNPHKSKK